MALVTNITTDLLIPGENETVVIRKLSHKNLREAQKARQSEGVGFMKELGAELLRALQDNDTDKLKRMQDTQEADINSYDRDTLLRLGVVSWTYKVPPVAISKDGVTNGLDELDEPTAKYIAEAIFKFSRPETKSDAKNASSASIGS